MIYSIDYTKRTNPDGVFYTLKKITLLYSIAYYNHIVYTTVKGYSLYYIEGTVILMRFDFILCEELAQRIYDISDVYEMRDLDITPKDIRRDIENETLAVINYLVSMIEDLQA